MAVFPPLLAYTVLYSHRALEPNLAWGLQPGARACLAGTPAQHLVAKPSDPARSYPEPRTMGERRVADGALPWAAGFRTAMNEYGTPAGASLRNGAYAFSQLDIRAACCHADLRGVNLWAQSPP